MSSFAFMPTGLILLFVVLINVIHANEDTNRFHLDMRSKWKSHISSANHILGCLVRKSKIIPNYQIQNVPLLQLRPLKLSQGRPTLNSADSASIEIWNDLPRENDFLVKRTRKSFGTLSRLYSSYIRPVSSPKIKKPTDQRRSIDGGPSGESIFPNWSGGNEYLATGYLRLFSPTEKEVPRRSKSMRLRWG